MAGFDPAPFESVVEATEAAIRCGAMGLTDADVGAVAVLRRLAALIDRPASVNDNVSIPTYLKYCEALGLTPAARLRQKPEAGVGAKLAGIKSGVRRRA